jgi:benzoyl-CoA reductase/2-hydroxyglutaryl-CoA dehydratase subunit BcrC/BadD/HgdB
LDVSALARIREAPRLAAARRRRDLAAGREVVGWFSPPLPPPELVEAAGALPWRLLENSGPDADLRGMGVLGRDTCSYCRSVLGSAVLEAPPVSCIAAGTSCDRLRHMADAWPTATGLPLFTVAVPRTREVPGQAGPLAAEFEVLAREISARTGVTATPRRLHEAFARGNRCRGILRELDELRREDPPRLTGSEFLDVVRAAHALTTSEFLEAADGLADVIRARPRPERRPVRILLVGPTLTDGVRDVVRMAEEDCGAAVVADLTDSGTLGVAELIDEAGEPFAALARQVLAHPILTAPLLPATAFRDAYRQALRDARPDGVVYRGVPFCRPFNSEAVPLHELSPVPFLDIRVESAGANGQIRTRLGAFLEAIEARRRFTREQGR